MTVTGDPAARDGRPGARSARRERRPWTSWARTRNREGRGSAGLRGWRSWVAEHVTLGGEHEVTFGEAIDLVRPDVDANLAPREVDVGVVVLLFGHGADAVYESERLLEVGELVRLRKMVVVDSVPVVELPEVLFHLRWRERRHATAAGD